MPNGVPADSWRAARWQGQARRALLAWFQAHARDLPWRREPHWYRVWVSEIMLQQTQVATVVPYFERFLEHFPTVEALAAAPEAQVLKCWEGLGYYRRARQLQAAAQRVVRDFNGEFPGDTAAAQSLPGIGRYTAGAILSIAFDRREPILEANTIRVLSRLTAFSGDPYSRSGAEFLWGVAAALLPPTGSGQFNQALMELGSLVCTPAEPDCSRCPLQSRCPTRALGLQAEIPRAKVKPKLTDVRHVAVVVVNRSRVLLRRCGADERWAGLWDFPRFELSPEAGDEPQRIAETVRALTGISIAVTEPMTTFRHGVTRYRITLDCFAARRVGGRVKPDVCWVAREQLGALPMHATGRRLARLLTASASR